MNEPCIDCGKTVRVDRAHWRTELFDGDDSLGWFTVGSECRRKYTDATKFKAS